MIGTGEAVVTLPEEAAWAFLRSERLGRLAYHLLGEVHLVPVNHVVVGDRLLFSTAPGSKLLGVVMDDDVAFEVDRVDGDRATSVVVRGRAELLGDREADAVRDRLESWVPTDKDAVVAVLVTEISGRHVRLDRRPPEGG